MIKFILISLLLTNILLSDTNQINLYLNKWLKKRDSALMFNYKTGKILYEYHSYMFDNRVPIGSIFKIVTTFLFLKNKKDVSKKYTYLCSSHKKEVDLPCWNKKGHGLMDLDSAFINSCNKFYYSLDLSVDNIEKTINYLGLNINFNKIKLKNNEKKLLLAGNLPHIKANFYELSKLISIFANNGRVIDIKSQKKLYNISELDIIKRIKGLMLEVIHKGTAHKVFFKSYGFSGKTGTASDENGLNNGVFIGFTKDKPYAIIVNLYNNIGSTSAMIASDIIYLYSLDL